ncbi:MAG: winged helix-turn-helix transcriptional regulator [Bryobacteraceae bacterium]|jgi:DNA-binding HxlR family transcriptional regulator
MAARKGYGQFCPVAKAAEIFAERWTPLVLRELIVGSQRFNELRRGLPLMSSALLSQRLKELEYAGIVEHRSGARKNAEYHLTEAGQELRPIIEALGFWGARWMRSRLTNEDYDPSLLMWDIRRNLDVQRLPEGQRTVIEINLHGAEPAVRRWWLVVDAGEVDLCMKDPGYEVSLRLSAELRAMVDVWTGRQSMDAAMRAGKLTFEGSRTLASSFRKCLKLSPFARAAS